MRTTAALLVVVLVLITYVRFFFPALSKFPEWKIDAKKASKYRGK